MEKNASYFAVGVFVTATMMGIFLFLIWLASPHDERSYDYYTVVFKDSISGLEAGANVEYKGVKVGKVIRLRLSTEDIEQVDVDIAVDKTAPVRAHTKAELVTQGITGLVRVSLATENSDTDKPVARPGEKYPVLQGEGSRLYKALEDLPDITDKILEISKKLDNLLDQETVDSLKQSMKNLEHLTRDFNGLLSQANVEHASTLVTNLSASSAQVPGLVKHFNKAADQMQSAATNVNGVLVRNRGSIDRFASQGLNQLTVGAGEAKGAAESLHSLADKLKADPSQLLYQPSSHGVEIPK